jgi:DHA2 family multidrug resistance protein
MTTNSKTARAAWATLTHDSLNIAQPSKKALGKTQFIFLNFGLLLGNVLVLFNTGAFAAVTLHACGELGISPSHSSWFQGYYFVSLALALPVSSWAANRFGEVRLYFYSMLLMGLASLWCAETYDLTSFVSGRMLQGFFGGLTIPLSQSLLMREYPEKSKAFAVSLWSIAALTPFTLGPATGGWIADELGWRWLFLLNPPLSLLASALVWALLFDRPTPSRKQSFDICGFLFLTGALFCLQSVLNQGQDADWFNSVAVMIEALIGLLLMTYFIIWELDQSSPLLNLRLLTRRNFVIGSLLLSLGFMMMYGLLSVLLIRLQVIAGYTSFLAGCVLLPLIFLAKPLAALMHRIVHRYDARLLASLNMLLFAAYCGWSSTFDFFGRGSWFSRPLWSQILEGFCLGGLFVPLTTLFLSGLNAKRQIQAVELGGSLRVLAGGAASPLFGVFWERRAAFHQSRLTESFSMYDHWSSNTLNNMQSAGIHAKQAVAELATTASQHAAVLALNDAFRLACWLFLGLAMLVWLAKPVGPATVTAKDNVRLAGLEDLIEEP